MPPSFLEDEAGTSAFSSHNLRAFLASRKAVACLFALLLAAHFGLAVTSAVQKSCTVDEFRRLSSGYAFWGGVHTIEPESGALPKMWAALPFLFMKGWDQAAKPSILPGRIMMMVMSLGFGAAVFFISMRMFGTCGGLISLFLYAFSPTILAHGRLITSDLASALFFVLAPLAVWRDLNGPSWKSFILTPLCLGGVLLSKMSGLLIAPMALVLFLLSRKKHKPDGGGSKVEASVNASKPSGLAVFGMLLVQGALALFLVWGAYGFERETPLAAPPVQGESGLVRDCPLTPPAYNYGAAFVLRHARDRRAFMNGETSGEGWRLFFPFALAVKTPLFLFPVTLLSLISIFTVCGRSVRKALTPLAVLLGVYWTAAVLSRLNIGHRHILLTYPVLFIAAGALGPLLKQKRKAAVACILVCLTGFFVESVLAWPDYLAFFNAAAGGRDKGYTRLVDSSLDWGQDLPGFRKWLDDKNLNAGDGPPVYFSFFGVVDPALYGINAREFPRAYSQEDVLRGQAPAPLEPGCFAISATNFQQVSIGRGVFGAWTPALDAEYWRLKALVSLFRAGGAQAPESSPVQLALLFSRFEDLRFARLCRILHRRPPDELVGGSILLFFTPPEELQMAVSEPIFD